MKTFTLVLAAVFSAAATVWPAGAAVFSAEPVKAAGADYDASAEPCTRLSDAIRNFVWDLRRSAIRHWFQSWEAPEPLDELREFEGFRGFGPDLPTDDWWEAGIAAPKHRAVVELETSGRAVAAASGRGTAVSLAVVDGHYEIEAAYSGDDGPQRFRTRGTRDEVERWAAQLPRPLRRAVERQLAFENPEDPAW